MPMTYNQASLPDARASRPLGATDPGDRTLPLYGARWGQAISRFFRSYARFCGRASRSEYWWVMLTQTMVAGLLVSGVILFGIDSALGYVCIVVLAGFVLVWAIPAWALTVRRLHDADFSGWMALLTFVPYIGSVMPIVFGLLPSKPRGECFDRR
ncbi:DUF805 domain-containing protein [Mycobacteroides abscessus]|uniref:DUF805 domain-containing protein n=2 Tax=Mycobacteroides abscessus TaxID=36809 RepID=UPI002E2764A6